MLTRSSKARRIWVPAVTALALVGIASLLIGTQLTGGDSPGARQSARGCEGEAFDAARGMAGGSGASLRGSFAVSAETVAAWQETRLGPDAPRVTSDFRERSPAQPVTVCFYDGNFVSLPRPPGEDVHYERLVLIVDADGTVIVDTAGPANRIPVRAPEAAGR